MKGKNPNSVFSKVLEPASAVTSPARPKLSRLIRLPGR